MSKRLFIAEKPSVAQEFARILKVDARRGDGYLESEDTIVTWCVGHLVTMSYPEVYDETLKKWAFETLPFLPETFRYEVIPNVKKQFNIVSGLLNREDVDTIYVCTDSGREGEYIYRLVDQMAKVPDKKKKLRVWIDSQTEDEIKRGIREAKPLAEYDNLSDSAYLRAREDYLMGINFSRALSLKYGYWLNNNFQNEKWTSVSVGRVMTCVLGMVVTREWEIRNFVKTPFYRVLGTFELEGKQFQGEWKAVEGSKYFASPALYKENGFKEKENALALIDSMTQPEPAVSVIESVEKKRERKNPPLLFNLAELQNLSSKLFKISPDETLAIVQELYEKKLVTYPRTDARVLSSAVAKEIGKNLRGLQGYEQAAPYLSYISENQTYKGLEKTRYVNDKQITDHYAIIPTGQGLSALQSLAPTQAKMYEVIVRRFLSIFYPSAVYQKLNVSVKAGEEHFFTSAKILLEEGFLPVSQFSFAGKKKTGEAVSGGEEENGEESELQNNDDLKEILDRLKKDMPVSFRGCEVKEGETSPPKRYNSGSMILAMENAGQLIEDEELRAQIKGSGIGTSATRAEILKKLVNIHYLNLNKKTQIITPTLKGELVCGIVRYSMPAMLSPKLTASWEKGLTGVAEGEISEDEYMKKLTGFVSQLVNQVKAEDNRGRLNSYYQLAKVHYKEKKKSVKSKKKGNERVLSRKDMNT
ncbi:MAG: type IA DNA topoisomerase [Lachnospiraceae bacterium]|nr:type IA DNA topoisomerase [Lachnospiraceae bacterium]